MKIKINYSLLIVFLFSFSVTGEEIKENKQTVQLDKTVNLNLVCKLKDDNYEPKILSGFSLNSVYNYREVRIGYANTVSKFIPTEVRIDKDGIEIMKGEMIDKRGRRAYIEFKDGSSFSNDIYTPKDEWNCIDNKK